MLFREEDEEGAVLGETDIVAGGGMDLSFSDAAYLIDFRVRLADGGATVLLTEEGDGEDEFVAGVGGLSSTGLLVDSITK